ncbi:hypothetical protein [Arthrobacter sp. YD2]|uniref:hypothetical protein n=1 Tax=Arthrobacter sp. YD2 TaxID=3058046 RepID=UPI0025B505BD|nr:hypothetical protein [Arthrobacter sp. YD2]MDN3904354.1 hypothetical protein [Arthrobacter sp. YD2]
MISESQFSTLMTEDVFGKIEAPDWLVSEPGGPFSQHASWAVWSKRTDVGPVKASQDMTVVESYDALKDIIHNNVILLGFNSGTHAPGAGAGQPWANFHCGSRDYLTAYGTAGTPLEGAYITDFYKGLPTRNSKELKDKLKAGGPEYEAGINKLMTAVFDREMEIIGAAPEVPVICLGFDTYQAFSKAFGDSRPAFRAPHAGHVALNKAAFADEMRPVIAAAGL